jgi:hypothetical protein
MHPARVDDDQEAAEGIHSQSDVALLADRGEVLDRRRPGIAQRLLSMGKADAVLPQV